MKTYTDIQENWALSALLGKAPTCCYATETIGYIVRVWEVYEDGEHVCMSEKLAKNYAQAKQIAAMMRG